MSKSKIRDIITLHQTKFLNFYRVIYENKCGEKKDWLVASRKNPHTIRGQLLEGKKDQADAVVLVATHQETNQLVLVKQFRVPINDYLYELPAGLIDEGEEILKAATRELREETGLELIGINKEMSCKKCYLSPGMTDESVSMIYCECKGEVSEKYLEADEEIIPILVDQNEARKIIQSQAPIDIKALMALQQFINA